MPENPSEGWRFPEPTHNHRQCVQSALERAESLCRARGCRLTEQRRRVLALIWQSHRPVGAYALLDGLRESGHNAAPPTVYRALEFLLEQGLIHRVESLNAYVGCPQPEEHHHAQFLVCRACETALELDARAIDEAVADCAAHCGFKVERQTVEVRGLCPRCQRKTHHG